MISDDVDENSYDFTGRFDDVDENLCDFIGFLTMLRCQNSFVERTSWVGALFLNCLPLHYTVRCLHVQRECDQRPSVISTTMKVMFKGL